MAIFTEPKCCSDDSLFLLLKSSRVRLNSTRTTKKKVKVMRMEESNGGVAGAGGWRAGVGMIVRLCYTANNELFSCCGRGKVRPNFPASKSVGLSVVRIRAFHLLCAGLRTAKEYVSD